MHCFAISVFEIIDSSGMKMWETILIVGVWVLNSKKSSGSLGQTEICIGLAGR